MFSRVATCGLTGLDGHLIEVETDISNGIPAFDVVGLADTSVKEARERVRAAIKNSGFKFSNQRITLNLAPADIRKDGTDFDLPIAIGILVAAKIIPEESVKAILSRENWPLMEAFAPCPVCFAKPSQLRNLIMTR